MRRDVRLTPANARVADAQLRGQVDAPRHVAGVPRRASVPLVDLCRTPGGARDRQLQLGEAVTLYEVHEGSAFVACARDGYVGYVPAESLGAGRVTHRVAARATHLYPVPDLKRREIAALGHGALVEVVARHGRFAETPGGYLPLTHLVPAAQRWTDPVAVAELYLGTPYLWGGNSVFGVDCSGLVQAGCLACGLPCPGDSDQQAEMPGKALSGSEPLRRGDLLFWAGHVAWVAAPDLLLHANAHAMAVSFEPLADAIARIDAQGDGPVTVRRRLPLAG